jgi:hypothetical protein
VTSESQAFIADSPSAPQRPGRWSFIAAAVLYAVWLAALAAAAIAHKMAS